MGRNTRVKNKLIELYGPECFIEKLHLRKDPKRKYTSKAQKKKMKELTYHHIRERSKGGDTSIENGAILSAENHQWFNKQSPEAQAYMNKKFQEYKECKVVFTDDIQPKFKIEAVIFEVDPEKKKIKTKYNRAKEKRDFERRVEEEYVRDYD